MVAPLHPRNQHQGHYDFERLIACCEPLAAFVITTAHGQRSIDFANPLAVQWLNRALLRDQYGIEHWSLPPGYLCPPVPGRADYIHALADLLASDSGGVIPRGNSVCVLDIGVGANCIYPLLGHASYGWQFVGAEMDPVALAAANLTVQANALGAVIELREQCAGDIFRGIVAPGEHFALTMCNPPFHPSNAAAARGSQRKWRNLGKTANDRAPPNLNFGGHSHELSCPGGEAAFVRQMINESTAFATQVGWFTTLVSRSAHLPAIEQQLKHCGAREVRTIAMAQGNKQSRLVAWRFGGSTR